MIRTMIRIMRIRAFHHRQENSFGGIFNRIPDRIPHGISPGIPPELP